MHCGWAYPERSHGECVTAVLRRMTLGIGGAAMIASAVWMLAAIRRVHAMFDQGNGGVGSAGVDSLGYVLPLLLTVWLFRRTRGQGRIAQRLRTAYALSMAGLFTVFALFISELFLPRELFGHGLLGWYLFQSSFFAAAVWLPVQAFFAAAFVSVLATRTPATVA